VLPEHGDTQSMELGYKDISSMMPLAAPLDDLRESLRQDGRARSARRLMHGGIATAAAVVVFALVGLAYQAVQQPVAVNLDTEATTSETFDSTGRFIMRSFDLWKPMSSFLAGVGGLWGVPMWSFYVNRGQGIATFGVQNKDQGILMFQTAEKAYQATPYVGFRTFLKGTRSSGATFEAQPFFPSSDADEGKAPRRDMYIGVNEMEVEESDPTSKMRTNALYFTVPNEDYPMFVRRVTYTNEGSDSVSLEAVDGLAKLAPAGTGIMMLQAMGRTLEGWMHVYNTEEDNTAPFFHLVTVPADTADVALIEDGHFAVALEDGSEELLEMICDPTMIFGTDTTLSVPRNFFSSKKRAGGAPLAELLSQKQSTTSKTPSAFATASLQLAPGESKTLSIVYGHAPSVDVFMNELVPKIKAKGYITTKREEAQKLGLMLTDRVAMKSGVPLLDNYATQNYLDNLLRGGIPFVIGDKSAAKPKIFHAFSRIHGDLERDYNNFNIDPTYWSQGPGNYRDVQQNRRCDILQMPAVHDFNVRQFFSYIQHDGYNQLTVATAFFKIRDESKVDAIAAQIAPPGSTRKTVKTLLMAPFRPGQLFADLAKKKITIEMDKEKLLELVTAPAEQVPAGAFSQNGFWTDHFTYSLDLISNFLAVFPDEKASLLYDAEPVPFFLSPSRVANRTEKNVLVSEGKVRQYDAIADSKGKMSELEEIWGGDDFVGDTTAGGIWQRTADGSTMTVSIIAKLILLGTNKFAIMDYLGMGVSMEGGKPGWNDAMNGLPALFGSEMPAAYELYKIIEFAGAAVDEAGRPVELPEELGTMLAAIDSLLFKVAAGSISDFTYWDKVNDALEAYRTATDATFTGVTVSWIPEKLGTSKGVLGRMLARMEQGVKRALSYAPDDAKVVSPTYFKFEVSSYDVVGKSGTGTTLAPHAARPTVKVTGFKEPVALPLFLEGPVRHLKTLKPDDMGGKMAVYKGVEASTLYDTELSMYKISESLKGQPLEIGRMMAFNAGWLENESVWMHMSYKWYLELLRAGLYTEFFKEVKKGVACFLDVEVFGRSPLEAASFIVSSAFDDKSLWGSGFLPRLSGTTAEFLSMWNHMMLGAAPFSLDSEGKLQLALEPVIASWMWQKDGTLLFKFLGAVEVTYVSKSKKNSWESTVTGYELTGESGTETVAGAAVPSPMAADVRALKYSAIKVTLA